MSEHQKLQAERKKDYEMIKASYTHLRQVIINDETLEQTKVALKKFKTSKKMREAGVRFNPALQRWLNIAEGRIARWERGHPELEPEKEPEKEPDKEPETKPDEKPESSEKEPEETSSEQEEPKDESEETSEEAAQPVGEETDTAEKVEEDPEPEEPETE